MKLTKLLVGVALALSLLSAPASAGVWLWSQTAASNSNADLSAGINWAEGQAPSTVNDSARAEMAEFSKWRDDLMGIKPANALLTSGGTANVQTLASNGSFGTLINGAGVCFTVGAGLTNTSAVTLNVDSLGAKAVQGIYGSALTGGELAASTVRCVSYRQPTDVWLLRGFTPVTTSLEIDTTTGAIKRSALTGDVTASAGSNATTIGSGKVTSGMIVDGTIATGDIADGAITSAKLNSSVLFMPVGMVFDFSSDTCPALSIPGYGQAISRTTYSALFAIESTTYGVGNGTTTFNVQDFRGRVNIAEDDAGGATTSADRITTTLDGDILGATGGEELHTQTLGEMAAHTHTQQGTFLTGSENQAHNHGFSGSTSADGAHTHTFTQTGTSNDSYTNGGKSANSGSFGASTGSAGSHTHTFSGTTATENQSHNHYVSIDGETASSGSSTPFNVVQPSIVQLRCIYAGV